MTFKGVMQLNCVNRLKRSCKIMILINQRNWKLCHPKKYTRSFMNCGLYHQRRGHCNRGTSGDEGAPSAPGDTRQSASDAGLS